MFFAKIGSFKRGKNIVICCDGTGNEYSEKKTNVLRVVELALACRKQHIYYDPGVGTGDWDYQQEGNTLKSFSDKITGFGLHKNIEEAYRFLMQVYKPKDRVYLFGFSRGAFTVRSLSGMLHRCGLLRADLLNLIPYASKIYHSNDRKLEAEFKETFSIHCPIHFIGVWDTIDSLTLNAGKRFHDTKLMPEVKYAYQALALDERRSDFRPCLWDESKKEAHQTIEQLWFAGVHADVGGGYTENGLSEIALKWIVLKAKAAKMKLKDGFLDKIKADPLSPIHDSFGETLMKKILWKVRGNYERKVPEKAAIHISVKIKMENSSYTPHQPLPRSIAWAE